ncbi:MAG: 30S ribosomal protein S18 [bacterium]|nr:30S ribosomal protein S18 [bacterium]
MQQQCHFCTTNQQAIDYKDGTLLRRFLSAQSKIRPTRKTNLCASHQRMLKTAIKRARYLGLVPYTLH